MVYDLFEFSLYHLNSLYCSYKHIVSDRDDGVSEEAQRAGRRWQATLTDVPTREKETLVRDIF